MKKVIIMLAVVAMAAPTFADVIFTGDGSTGSLVISYTTTDGDLPRGIGLKCEVLAGDTVDVDAAGTTTDAAFNTNIDYAFSKYLAAETYAIGDGNPLADPDGPGVLDPTTGVSVFSLCMGVLDQSGNQGAGPATAASLVSVPVSNCSSASVTIRISEDDLRGGVVGSALTTNLPIDVVVSCAACTTCQGDLDNDNVVGLSDFMAYFNVLNPVAFADILPGDAGWHDCGDVDGDNVIGLSDFMAMFNKLNPVAFADIPCPAFP